MFSPTDEQLAAVEMFRGGDSLAIEAGAGTGKTSTLMLLGSVDPYRRGMYVAFNKAIVTEAGEKMPRSVTCSTAHSLAFRAIVAAEGGRAYAARLRGSRMKSNEIAAILRIDPITVHTAHRAKPMAKGFLANLVMRAITRFCQTADPSPGIEHVPYIDGIDEPLSDGRRTYDNNMIVRRHIEHAIARAWGEIVDPQGQLPFRHDHYLKMWQLQGPKIDADYILFDEAQDANPVMVAIVAAQTHAQLVWVGDSQQAIYEFTGAVNALADVPADRRTLLTHSFRFGPEIADIANGILEVLGADLRLTGRGRPGVIGPVSDPDVLLTRTNATGVQTMFFELAQGRRPAIVGGAADVLAFARGATELREKGWTSHQDLTCFTSWGEVQEYVSNDEGGSDLALLVKLVDEFGSERIASALDNMPREVDADLLISTAHKAKGREWPTVKIAGDFPDPQVRDLDPSEWRLLYVACTRSRSELDLTDCPHALDPRGSDDAAFGGER